MALPFEKLLTLQKNNPQTHKFLIQLVQQQQRNQFVQMGSQFLSIQHESELNCLYDQIQILENNNNTTQSNNYSPSPEIINKYKKNVESPDEIKIHKTLKKANKQMETTILKKNMKWKQNPILREIFDISTVTAKSHTKTKQKAKAIKQMQIQFNLKKIGNLLKSYLNAELTIRVIYLEHESIVKECVVIENKAKDETQHSNLLKDLLRKQKNKTNRHKTRPKLQCQHSLQQIITCFDEQIDKLTEVLSQIETHVVDHKIVIKANGRYWASVGKYNNNVTHPNVAEYWCDNLRTIASKISKLKRLLTEFEVLITSKTYPVGSLKDIKMGWKEYEKIKSNNNILYGKVSEITKGYVHNNLDDKQFISEIKKQLKAHNGNVHETIEYFIHRNEIKIKNIVKEQKNDKQQKKRKPKKKVKEIMSKNSKNFFKNYFSKQPTQIRNKRKRKRKECVDSNASTCPSRKRLKRRESMTGLSQLTLSLNSRHVLSDDDEDDDL